MAPRHHPVPIATTAAAPANTDVRRSSATVATISGATLSSEGTTRPVTALSRPKRSSHQVAAAIAMCPADGPSLRFTR